MKYLVLFFIPELVFAQNLISERNASIQNFLDKNEIQAYIMIRNDTLIEEFNTSVFTDSIVYSKSGKYFRSSLNQNGSELTFLWTGDKYYVNGHLHSNMVPDIFFEPDLFYKPFELIENLVNCTVTLAHESLECSCTYDSKTSNYVFDPEGRLLKRTTIYNQLDLINTLTFSGYKNFDGLDFPTRVNLNADTEFAFQKIHTIERLVFLKEDPFDQISELR